MQDMLGPILARFRDVQRDLRSLAVEEPYAVERVRLGEGYTVRWRRELFTLVAELAGCETLANTVRSRRNATMTIVGTPTAIAKVASEYRWLRDAIVSAAREAYGSHLAEVNQWNAQHGSKWVTQDKRIDLAQEPQHPMRFYGQFCDTALMTLRAMIETNHLSAEEDILICSA